MSFTCAKLLADTVAINQVNYHLTYYISYKRIHFKSHSEALWIWFIIIYYSYYGHRHHYFQLCAIPSVKCNM